MRSAPDQRFLFLRGLRQILRIPSPDAGLETSSSATASISDDPQRLPRRYDRPRTTAGSGIGLTQDQDEPPALPPELQAHGQALQSALQSSSSDLEKVVQEFLATGFDSPSHTAAASRFILHHFVTRLPVLARVITPADLLSELRNGGSSLTQVIALRWDQTGENERLHQLAQACIDHAGSLTSSEAAEFATALAAAIAFRKPALARTLIDHAKPRLDEDSDEQLIPDAEQCLDAGLVLEHIDPLTRETWCHRLRFADRNWNWETRESQRILDIIAEHLRPDARCAPLFEQIIPEAQWRTLFHKANPASGLESEATSAGKNEPASDASSEPLFAPENDPRPVIVATKSLSSEAPALKPDSTIPNVPIVAELEAKTLPIVAAAAEDKEQSQAPATEPPLAPTKESPSAVESSAPAREEPQVLASSIPSEPEKPIETTIGSAPITAMEATAQTASDSDSQSVNKPTSVEQPAAHSISPPVQAKHAAPSHGRFLPFVTGTTCGLLLALGVWCIVPENQQTLLKLLQDTPLHPLVAQVNLSPQPALAPIAPAKLAPVIPQPSAAAKTPEVSPRSRVAPPAPPKPEAKPESKPKPAPEPEFVGPPVIIASLVASIEFIGPPFPVPTPRTEEKPLTIVSKPVIPDEFERWKQGRIDQILREFPALETWHSNVQNSRWKDASIVIAGRHPAAPAKSSAHRAFLTLLVLDPPGDRDVLRASHIAFARNLAAKDCLEVWEPLIAHKAPNSPEIRTAASIMAELMGSQLSADTRQRLERIVATP